MKKTLIIGVGNEFRKDDAAGLNIVRIIKEKNLPGVTAVESTGDITNFVREIAEYEKVIIVDSVLSGSDPGTIRRIDIYDPDVDLEINIGISTHWLGISETLKLAGNIGNSPGRTLIYGIEGADFSHGKGISPEVSNSIPAVIDEIISKLGD